MIAGLLLCLFAPAEAPPEAATWFPPTRTFRTHVGDQSSEQRGTLVLFFRSEDRGLARCFRRLSLVQRKGELVVMAVTDEDAEAASRLVRRAKPTFPVGAACDDFERFGVVKTPAWRLLATGSVGGARSAEIVSEEALQELSGADDPAGWEVTCNVGWNNLQDLMESGLSDHDQQTLLLSLYDAGLPTDARSAIGAIDDALLRGPEPRARGALLFVRAMLNGEGRTDREPSAAGLANQAFNRDRNAAQWAPVVEFERRADVGGLPAQAFTDHYFAYPGQDAVSLVMRFRVITAAGLYPNQRELRELYMAAVQDPDPAIRHGAVLNLGEACQPGDLEVADLLERLSQLETDWLYTRPAMEFAAERLRGDR